MRLAQPGGHLRRRDRVGAQAVGVEVDAHLAPRRTVDLDEATPSTRCRRRAHGLVGEDGGSRGLRAAESSAATTTGLLLSLLKRATVGVFASGEYALHHRHAVAHVLHGARHVGVERELDAGLAAPSKLREVMCLMPAMLFRPSSMGLLTSRSTASGEAPG